MHAVVAIGSAAAFAGKLLKITQGPVLAVGAWVTFASGLYAGWEWYWGGFEKNLIEVWYGNGFVRDWEALGRAVNKGLAMGFLAGLPWFGVALWTGIEGVS